MSPQSDRGDTTSAVPEMRETRAAAARRANAAPNEDPIPDPEPQEEEYGEHDDEYQDELEETKRRVERLEEECEILQTELLRVVNENRDKQIQHEEATKAKFEELEAKMAMMERRISERAAGTSAAAPTTYIQKVKVPEPAQKKGSRAAKDIDNFLWSLDQYFRATNVQEDEDRVNTAAMFLADDALLWWRRLVEDARRQGEQPIAKWDEFQKEFRSQFYPVYAELEARTSLHNLKQQGTVREYCQEFSKLMLQIPRLGEHEGFFQFINGLKPWVQQELQRREVTTLSKAISVAEALIEFKRPEAPANKGRDQKGKQPERSEQRRGGGDRPANRDERRDRPNQGRNNNGNRFRGNQRGNQNGANRGNREANGDKERRPIQCFICDGPHLV